jgi:hypothetical protein
MIVKMYVEIIMDIFLMIVDWKVISSCVWYRKLYRADKRKSTYLYLLWSYHKFIRVQFLVATRQRFYFILLITL